MSAHEQRCGTVSTRSASAMQHSAGRQRGPNLGLPAGERLIGARRQHAAERAPAAARRCLRRRRRARTRLAADLDFGTKGKTYLPFFGANGLICQQVEQPLLTAVRKTRAGCCAAEPVATGGTGAGGTASVPSCPLASPAAAPCCGPLLFVSDCFVARVRTPAGD